MISPDFQRTICNDDIDIFEDSDEQGPLLLKWTCCEVPSNEFRAWDSISNDSHQLPSISFSFGLPEMIELPDFKIHISELETTEGIDTLMYLAIKYLHEIRDSARSEAITDFLQVICIFERIVKVANLSEGVINHLDHCIMRILMKVNCIRLCEATLKKHAVMNPCLHAYIFSWKAAFIVFTDGRSTSLDCRQRQKTLLDELLSYIAVSLVKIYGNYKSLAPCSCMQSFIFLLFEDKEKRFEEAFFKCFQRVRLSGIVENGCIRLTECPSAMAFFNLYVNLTEYFLNVHKLKKDGEWTGRFLLRVFGMAEQLVAKDLLQVCETLVKFLFKNDPGNLSKLRLVAKKFWAEIIKFLEVNPIRELEATATDSSLFWSAKVLNSFSDLPVREIDLIRLLKKFLADKTLWDATKPHIKNYFGSKKISTRPQSAGTILTLLMSLCTIDHVGRELFEPENLPTWLMEAVETPSSSVQNAIFNANRALGDVCRDSGYPQTITFAKLLNKLPLPESNQIYLDQILAMPPYHRSTEIDYSRAEKLPESQFCELIEHFVDADWPLSSKVWLRANQIVESDWLRQKAGPAAKRFLINQFRAGLQEKNLFFVNRLNSLIEKFTKDPWQPEVLHFCSRIVESGRTFSLDLDKFIPLWISSVVAFSTSHEVEVRDFTRSIWEGIRQIVPKQVGETVKDNEPKTEWEEPINYVIQCFQTLQNAKNRLWAVQKCGLWFPSSLAYHLQSIIKKKENDQLTESRRGRAIEVFAALLENCSNLLYSYSEQNEAKVSFNASTLVIAVCALTDRDILHRRLPLLSDNLVGIVSGLAKIPNTVRRAIFIKSRLKDILLAYAQDPLGIRLVQAIKEQNVIYPVQLAKEYPQLGFLFESDF